MKSVVIRLALCVMISMLTACSATKFIPEGQYMLEGVKIRSSEKTLDVNPLKGYIRQHPNSKWFSLIKVPMGPYALSGKDTTLRINRFLQRIGEAPVVFDTLQANRSQDNMLSAVNNMGYLDAKITQEKTIRQKKVRLSYLIDPGVRYRVRRLDYQIDDSMVCRKVEEGLPHSLLHVGMPFDVNVLDAERARLSALLQNNGYYKFNKEFVRFEADTCVGNHEVDLKVVIPLYRASANDSLTLHRPYKIRKVVFANNISRWDVPDDTQGDVHLKMHRGFPVFFKNRLSFRPSLFTNNNSISPGALYCERDVQRTYSNFGQLGAVMYTNIKMQEVDSAVNMLDCYVSVQENKPRSFGAELEGTNSAGDLGAALSLSYQNRNLFKGSELFSIKLRGAFEAITGLEGYSDQNYMEVSVEAGLTFPNFKLFRWDSRRRELMRANSEVSLMYDSQNRPEFHRRVLTSALRYRWRSLNGLFQHRVDLIDLNYVFMPWISETFKRDYLDDVDNRNAILRYNYENLFIMKLGYSFNYNSQGNATTSSDYGTNALGIRLNVESSGNVLYGFSKMLKSAVNAENQYTLFNIAYAQYLKGDLDVSKSFRFDDRNSLALHVGVGVAYPYGNSTILPYEKRYFSGGANSVRGWSVRELGPGTFTGGDGRIDFINQTGDVKLDINAEYRTHLFWKLHGAVFVDAGNIWTIRNYEEQPGGQFKFHSFWRELAVSYGLGIRLNFDFFILRLDGGMKAVHPAYADARRHYPIIHPNFKRDFTLHFAVGLPF